ncbi:MAG: hypothetical protein PHQ10_04175 [Dehalococcoidales bacterium]|jgi:hypothetical protein|nr:hypothetical protein [Dehalococcoidales bacterium]MDD5498741.1 hypothetical protein [Dehalococcoidales bacterium]
MYKIVGLNEKDVMDAESFTGALNIFYKIYIDPVAQGKKPNNSETTGYIEAIGKTATTRMYYPYVFEFAVKAGLINNGKLVEPLIEPTVTDLIAEFSRAGVLQMIGVMGCH